MARLEVETTTGVRLTPDGIYEVYVGVLVTEADGTSVTGLTQEDFALAVIDGRTAVQVKDFAEHSTETGWPVDGLYMLHLWPPEGSEWPPGEQYACVLAVTRSSVTPGGEVELPGVGELPGFRWDRGQALFTFTLTAAFE